MHWGYLGSGFTNAQNHDPALAKPETTAGARQESGRSDSETTQVISHARIAQLIFEGTTDRVHPRGYQPDKFTFGHSKSDWYSVYNMIEVERVLHGSWSLTALRYTAHWRSVSP